MVVAVTLLVYKLVETIFLSLSIKVRYFSNCWTLSLHQTIGSVNPIIRAAAKAAPSSSRTVTHPKPSWKYWVNKL